MLILRFVGARPTEQPQLRLCNRHLSERSAMSDGLAEQPYSSRPSSPFGTYRTRTPSFSDPGLLQPFQAPASPFSASVNYSFDTDPTRTSEPLSTRRPRLRRSSNASSMLLTIQLPPLSNHPPPSPLTIGSIPPLQPLPLPPLSMSGSPPRAFTDMLQSTSYRPKTPSPRAMRPYY